MSNSSLKKSLLKDLRRCASKLGESPTVRQYEEEGEHPVSAFQRQFGSWNIAKEQAELETYSQNSNQQYTDDELLDYLKNLATKIGEPATYDQFRTEEGPHPSSIVDRFGTWNSAKKKAGLETNPPHSNRTSYDSEKELLDDLRLVAEKLGKSPSVVQYREHGKYHPATFQHVFDYWNNAKEQAGLNVYEPDKWVPAKDLIQDLQQTADSLGTTPSKEQYNEHGNYSSTICQKRFKSWNNALTAADIELNVEMNISEKSILDDIQNVASIVDETPTISNYREYGKYSLNPLIRHFESWIGALSAAGYDWDPYQYSDKELLMSLRNVADDKYSPSRLKYSELWTHKNISRRFGSWWAGCVQAGLLPLKRRPLSPKAIHEYHKAAINLDVHYRTYALLFQFTGMPPYLVEKFSTDWVADRRRRNIIRVPFEETKTGEPWIFEYPDSWLNPYTGETEATELPETLNWFTNNYNSSPRSYKMFSELTKQVAKQGNLEKYRRTIFNSKIGYVPDVNPRDLRMTRGVNLAEQGVGRKTINHCMGIKQSSWDGDAEDCYLWAYMHRDTVPPNYDPPDVILDIAE